MTEQHEERKDRILSALRDPASKRMDFDELAVWLDVPKEERKILKEWFDGWVAEGTMVIDKRGRYDLSERLRLLKGRYQSNPRGFGFVVPETGTDLFIPPDEGLGAMNGDLVLCRMTDGTATGRREGTVTHILERAHQRVVGRFTALTSGGYVTPDSQKINGDVRIEASRTMGATTGQKVVVRVTRWPDGVSAATGEIIVVLGAESEPGVDVLSVLWQHGIAPEFPANVIKEAETFPQVPDEADFADRLDLREMSMVTIDGEDARDLDDAVSLERLQDGRIRLGVHIADVAHYVKEGSVLDLEAFERGTSVYLPDRVIPMLPQALSNGLCSLTSNVPRLAMSVLMEMSTSGEVLAHEIHQSVICTDARLTYTEVQEMLTEEDGPVHERYRALVPMIRDLRSVAEQLGARRKARGSIDFLFDESKIVVDGEGKPIEIKRVKPNEATNLIEECMLVCNEVVSAHYHDLGVPFVYRIHEDPDPQKMTDLRLFLAGFGYSLPPTGTVHPGDLQRMLDTTRGKAEERTIGTMTLRSMQKARYSHKHVWHFGLAAPYYSHFTSPIRRYPDLLIHRIMKEVLTGKLDVQRKQHYEKLLPQAALNCSERERAADAAERECVDMKKAEFMQAHVGETFTGTVSGVTSFGVFVELANTVEGLLRRASLHHDEYEFNERLLQLEGEHTKAIIRIGDTMEVLVAKASPETRQVEFVPPDASRLLVERIASGKAPEKEQTFAQKGRKYGGKADSGGNRGKADSGGNRGKADSGGNRDKKKGANSKGKHASGRKKTSGKGGRKRKG